MADMSENFRAKGGEIYLNVGVQLPMYQPRFPKSVPFRPALPGGDSVAWVERLLEQAGVRTIQLRIKDKRHLAGWKPTLGRRRYVIGSVVGDARLFINDYWRVRN